MTGRPRARVGQRARRPLAPSETEFQDGVLELLQLLGFTGFHHPDSRRATAPGWPDLSMLHVATGVLAFAELKTDVGQLSPAQVLVLAGLRRGGHPVYLWRPPDLRDGTIQRELLALRAGRRPVHVELVDR